ncbi:olfactory receptor 11A1-like [Esox lucius]|uniref:olfactory receptor 11A1-like n=1 Tax=Esox lucius TaxID=8010 RepID=UPI001476EAD6|nr:olfactory receptor 11A1-like [Esox lucius]
MSNNNRIRKIGMSVFLPACLEPGVPDPEPAEPGIPYPEPGVPYPEPGVPDPEPAEPGIPYPEPGVPYPEPGVPDPELGSPGFLDTLTQPDGYSDTGQFKYLYFLIITVLYISIWLSNTLLIVVICKERSLHKPMYLFLCSLFVNDLYGSTALFPAFLSNLLLDAHSISTVYCYLQILCIYTYACIELCNLAVMSYDRYLAICYPLQYNVLMTPKKAYILICLIWMVTFVNVIINLSLTIRLQLCGNVIVKVYCDNYLVVKLACSTADTAVNNIHGLYCAVLLLAAPLLTIVFSYIKILTICLKSSIEMRQKAVSTCSPHLASLFNFSVGCFLTVIQSRIDRPVTHVPAVLQTILSVYFLMCQPLFNPIVYGVRMSKIRQAFKKYTTHRYAT